MTELLKYKGYQGTVEPDLESNILCGKVLFIKSLLVYEANTISELKERFEQLIDEYLEDCKAEGIEPEKPFSGNFNIRISPTTHKKLAISALRNDHSLNEEVKIALEEYVARSSDKGASQNEEGGFPYEGTPLTYDSDSGITIGFTTVPDAQEG